MMNAKGACASRVRFKEAQHALHLVCVPLNLPLVVKLVELSEVLEHADLDEFTKLRSHLLLLVKHAHVVHEVLLLTIFLQPGSSPLFAYHAHKMRRVQLSLANGQEDVVVKIDAVPRKRFLALLIVDTALSMDIQLIAGVSQSDGVADVPRQQVPEAAIERL